MNKHILCKQQQQRHQGTFSMVRSAQLNLELSHKERISLTNDIDSKYTQACKQILAPWRAITHVMNE